MLDVSIRTELLRLMLDLREERGLTYLFITHDLSLAWVIADRIAVMYLGKIMEIGPAEAVIRSPRNPYTAALVSVSPSPGSTDRRVREPSGRSSSARRPDAAHIPTGCRFHPRCPSAFDRCRVEEPPLFDVGGGGRRAGGRAVGRCWLGRRPRRPPPTVARRTLPTGGDERRVRRPRGAGAATPAADAEPSGSPADRIRRRRAQGSDLATEFAGLRSESVALVRSLTSADLGRVGIHPEVGELRVDELLGEWVHHDRNHVRQLLAVTQARVWDQMGNARRFSLAEG